MSVTKLSKSKTLKVFLVVIVLVFSFQVNVNKPKAFAPIVGWGLAVLTGMAAETLVTMGVKSASKAVLKNKAESYSAEMARTGQFDWAGTNPYRNKDGSITVSPSVNDRAKIAGLISGSLIGLLAESQLNPDVCLPSNGSTGTFYPLGLMSEAEYDYQGVQQAQRSDFSANIARFKMAYQVRMLRESKKLYIYDRLTNDLLWEQSFSDYISSTTQVKLSAIAFYPSSRDMSFGFFKEANAGDGQFSYALSAAVTLPNPTNASVDNALAVGETYDVCGDIVMPSTLDNVYPAPMDMSSSFKMPNHDDLAKIPPITIYNVLPAGQEGPISWGELDKYYEDNDLSIDDVINGNVDTILERGDIVNNPVTVEEINNHYTDVHYPVKVPDFNPDRSPAVPDEPQLPTDPKEEVDDLDHSIWEVLRNTYNYLDDGIDSSLAAMKGITDSAKGITNYLASAMGWLPPEWRAVFTSAFVLGVFAHFLRR